MINKLVLETDLGIVNEFVEKDVSNDNFEEAVDEIQVVKCITLLRNLLAKVKSLTVEQQQLVADYLDDCGGPIDEAGIDFVVTNQVLINYNKADKKGRRKRKQG